METMQNVEYDPDTVVHALKAVESGNGDEVSTELMDYLHRRKGFVAVTYRGRGRSIRDFHVTDSGRSYLNRVQAIWKVRGKAPRRPDGKPIVRRTSEPKRGPAAFNPGRIRKTLEDIEAGRKPDLSNYLIGRYFEQPGLVTSGYEKTNKRPGGPVKVYQLTEKGRKVKRNPENFRVDEAA